MPDPQRYRISGRSRRARAVAVAAGIGAALAHGVEVSAAEADAPPWSVSGYGTLGAVRSSEDRADYLVDVFKPTGPGFTRRWSADVDSRVGVQVTANPAPRLSAVLQVVSQQRYDSSYAPTVEWANVQYRLTPELSVRAGRIVLPVFMVTDSRKVGYANAWVRPPVEVYSLVPLTNNDGADARFRMPIGDYTNSVEVSFGRSDAKFPDPMGTGHGTAKASNVLVVVDTLERGFASARVSYGRARLTIDTLDPLFDAFRQFGPPGEAIAERFALEDKRVTFAGVGASYDPGPWFAIGEWARFETHSVVGARHAWYLSGGYRIGKWTPYATCARTQGDGETSTPGLPLTGLPAPLAGVAAGLNAALNGILADVLAQRTVSVGARWDFRNNAALKLQFDRVDRAAGSSGTFGNAQPGFQRGGRANVFSAAVDFVF